MKTKLKCTITFKNYLIFNIFLIVFKTYHAVDFKTWLKLKCKAIKTNSSILVYKLDTIATEEVNQILVRFNYPTVLQNQSFNL